MSGGNSDNVDVVLCGTGSPLSASRDWHGRLRPCAPALMGLALLVFLWGLGYKLSLYHHPAKHTSQATAAKLWTDTRIPRLTPSLSGHVEHSPTGANALYAEGAPLPRLGSAAATDSGTMPRATRHRRSLIPPRSPPVSIAA